MHWMRPTQKRVLAIGLFFASSATAVLAAPPRTKTAAAEEESSAAAAQAAKKANLRIVSFNVGGNGDVNGKSWAKRRCAVASAIVADGTAIILIQEATLGKIPGNEKVDVYTDLSKILKGKNECGLTKEYRTDTGEVLPPVPPGKDKISHTHGAHIFYDPAQVTFVSGREAPLGTLLPESARENYYGNLQNTEKYFALGRFTHKQNGKTLVVSSLHLQCKTICVRDAKAFEKQSPAIIEGLITEAERLAPTAPIIIGGDFNQQRDEKAHAALTSAQFKDSRPMNENTPTYKNRTIDFIYYRGEREGSKFGEADASRFKTVNTTEGPNASSDHNLITTNVSFTWN